MKKTMLFIAVLAIFLFSGCASKINTAQAANFHDFKDKGIYVEEKSEGTAAALGLLPGGGSFYTKNYGLGVVNLLLWPLSILWDPVSGTWGAESINYHATVRQAKKEKKVAMTKLDRDLEDNLIDEKTYIRQKRDIEDKYDVI